MTGPRGGIEDAFGGPARAAAVLITVVVVGGVALGVVAHELFGGADTADTAVSTTRAGRSGSATASGCTGAPSADISALDLTGDGLAVSAELSTSCDEDVVWQGSDVVFTVSAGGRDVAAATFDLSADPIVVASGESVQRKFVFPAGMYWRTPELVSGETLTVDLRNVDYRTGESTPDGSPRLTATRAADPANGTAESTATSALPELAQSDYGAVKRSLENRWVPQISSKQLGLVADGITYQDADILRNHLTLRQRYDNVKLVWSNDWTTFNGSNWWVTVVGQPFGDAAQANGWCDTNRIDPFNCFAKMISSIYGTEGTTVLRN